MFDIFYLGSKPNLFPHEQLASSIDDARNKSRTRYCWVVSYLSDYSDWDWLYEPPPWQSKYIHVWPSQWNEFNTFLVPKKSHDEYHFHDRIVCNLESKERYVQLINQVDFDYSWSPHPLDPPYIYVFGNQWWPAEVMPTIEYHVPGATEIKYVNHPRAQLKECHNNRWHTLEDCEWDYSWLPDPGDPPYIYVFGNQWHRAESMPTVEYHVPGATEKKFMSWPKAILLQDKTLWSIPSDIAIDDFDFSWVPDPGSPPYQYQFGTQWQKTGGPIYTVPGATDKKFISYPRAVKVSTDPCWTVPSGADTQSFDWTWHPDSTDPPYIYQFATQHQKTGGPVYTVSGASEIKYVDQLHIKTQNDATAIFEIDHLDGNQGKIPNVIKTVRYFDNYKDTLLRLAKGVEDKHEWIWICSSICDYTNFDFSWHPEKWQSTMLHVFSSNDQKFGDTFFMHVPTFVQRAEQVKLLEWYDVNFVDISVPRRPMPVIKHDHDSHVDVVKNTDWQGPLALFTKLDFIQDNLFTVPLWRKETKTIVPLTKGASSVIVPRVAVADVKTQLYDYPYIDKTRQYIKDYPLDIVFISNGEPNAEANWRILQNRVIEGLDKNKLHKISNVDGRVAAYHAAAQTSTTPWFFAVFAKLEIDRNFDWTWQPDRMQQPKHYIFHAGNPVNGLVYGHQAMIAYNRDLVLSNTGQGLDFTLDSAHEVVPIVSGTAHYAESPWMAWRTAFREALKLRASLPDVENEYRLKVWLTEDSGTIANGHWSHKGAQDAVEYYDQVNGDFAALKKSYEWEWLASYALMRRNLIPDR